MAIRTDEPAPYAPPATIRSVIGGFRDRGLATPFTNDVLRRAGVTESLAPRTLAALKSLGLIDDKGEPTETFEGLRLAPADEYQARLADVVRAAYEDIFQFVDPAKDPRTRVDDAFRPYKPASQRKRMVILFLGLCQTAGIVPEDTVQTREPRGSYTRPEARTKKTREESGSGKTRKGGGVVAVIAGDIPAPIQGLLAALPADGWTQAQRKKFLDTFTAVLDFSIPIQDDERPQTNSVEEEV